MKIIKRKEYIDNIRHYLWIPLVKIITGQRRIWKSVILSQLMDEFSPKETIYINKELSEWSHVSEDYHLEKYLEEEIKIGKKYIFIDEVQKILHWENALVSLLSKYGNKIDIIVTGSNSRMLSKELGTYLAGRNVQIHIHPFGYDEYRFLFDLDINRESFEQFLKAGTFPAVYQLPNEIQEVWTKQLVDSIFIKEIYSNYTIDHTDVLLDLFAYLTNTIGSKTNISNIQKHLEKQGRKVSVVTLNTYVQYLKDAYLIYGVSGYDLRGKKFFDKEQKYYISNPAMRFFQHSRKYDVMWSILENYIYLEGKRYWRTMSVAKIKDKEIDFIAEKNNEKMYIQVAYELSSPEVIEREFSSLEMIKDSRKKYVISMDSFEWVNENGIHQISAWNSYKIFS